MCKYCNLKEERRTGEKHNDNKKIMRLKDGCLVIDLSLNRYIVDEDNIHKAELVFDMAVATRTGVYGIKEQYMAIGYCPFCGEKL